MKRFYDRFRGRWMTSSCDCCTTVEMYQYEAEVFAENQERARELLFFWIPRAVSLEKNNFVVTEAPEVSREGVLFLSRELIYRGSFENAPPLIPADIKNRTC